MEELKRSATVLGKLGKEKWILERVCHIERMRMEIQWTIKLIPWKKESGRTYGNIVRDKRIRERIKVQDRMKYWEKLLNMGEKTTTDFPISDVFRLCLPYDNTVR